MFPDINDVTPNVTRFLVVCSASTATAPMPSGDDKTSFVFVCEDTPGALVAVLDAFRRKGVNLTHIAKSMCGPELQASLVAVSDVSHPALAGGQPRRQSSPGTAPAAGSSSELGATAAAATEQAGHVQSQPPQAPHGIAPSLLVPALLGGRGGATSRWTYAFFIDAEGAIASQHVADAVADAAQHCVCVKVLGSYPRARRVL
jgi:hypothetical protein